MAAKKTKKITKKPAAKTKQRKPMSKLDQVTVGEINRCAEHVYGRIENLGKPELKLPERSRKTARYDK